MIHSIFSVHYFTSEFSCLKEGGQGRQRLQRLTRKLISSDIYWQINIDVVEAEEKNENIKDIRVYSFKEAKSTLTDSLGSGGACPYLQVSKEKRPQPGLKFLS